ncbi:A-kinase anchor protein 1, mitochondrial [Drosophila subpulchrella]|uniref:A-kinase anchor protein 1, mitochondrial n=1 Tax=Drosophila subpulchrella TaxID=1486046 RepID=UPI0018A18B0E|nr:A-kinase anchor protein 1, mitochondrial [Drosophila subpulchrella]XP_037724080.1 A-kinase anchor protein 1, mitochondrial [Drosophila subpulchrella]
MVSGRPLLYLSLPGVAFILGVFWFRRRNKNRLDKPDDEDTSAIKDSAIEPTVQARKANGVLQNGKLPQQPPSKSMNINGTIANGSGSGGSNSGSGSDEKDSPTMLYGKSAPIKIQSNGRTSNGKHQQQIDSEMLKSKIQDAEHKKLCSIDEDFENLSSPRDLPDSVNTRVSFYNRKASQKTVEPVVIKATRTPKISPENSFLDTNYTTKEECEQNNNCEPKEKGKNGDVAKEETTKKSNGEQEQEPELEPEQTVLKEELVDSNGNPKRNVDAASPSLSICSVQSGDSGKGSSLPRSEATRVKTTYEFLFPISLIGHLYGRKRTFINQIKAKTLASVVLSKNPYSSKVRICTIEGTESEIDAALAMIRQRLPAKRYPNFTMQRIHFALPQTIVPLSTESLYNLQLKLIEGINNDVVVSAVLSGSHVFIQHPLHPSHPSLPMLQKQLYDSYSTMESPLLPSLEISAVCVIPINGVWYRVQIVDTDAEDEERCLVKFLDFGGYMNVGFDTLRQIRTDFMSVPFQATECILSNIEPIGETWSIEAAEILNQLTKGIVLQAQVAGYNSHNIPEIYLFASLGPNKVIFINKELVARNLAKWVEMRD